MRFGVGIGLWLLLGAGAAAQQFNSMQRLAMEWFQLKIDSEQKTDQITHLQEEVAKLSRERDELKKKLEEKTGPAAPGEAK